MASGIFAILDDIAVLLDDTAVMSKVAAKKTAAILGDDLAVNAEKATGFHASRELPVVWAITKGSLINKIIILPLAFLLSAYLPQFIIPILLIGGAYLCFEGAEKIIEWILPHKEPHIAAKQTTDKLEILKQEQSKIRSAIRTDFILSIEIIVIALGTVLEQHMLVQIMVVSLIAMVATVGVYGLVAALVRMDDVGLLLIEKSALMNARSAKLMRASGQLLVAALPKIVRLLGIIGTIAMLLVGGGIYTHNIETLHHWSDFLPSLLADLGIGFALGSVLFVSLRLIKKPGKIT